MQSGSLMEIVVAPVPARWMNFDAFGSRRLLLALTLSYFVAHTALGPAGPSFPDYRLLKNANYVTGLFLIFTVGTVLFATRALMLTILQADRAPRSGRRRDRADSGGNASGHRGVAA
jgi:hypothetical protein